jgi:hypothetical protein
MKKISQKSRIRSVKNFFKRIKKIGKNKNKKYKRLKEIKQFNAAIEKRIYQGLNIELKNQNKLTIHLPSKMNFSTDYENTASYLSTIRKLCQKNKQFHGAYKLTYVNFDNLKSISTSAALVLTAELSRWEYSIRKNLKPRTENWDPEILRKFTQLGFFKIFGCNDKTNIDRHTSTEINLIEYIKGIKGEKDKARELGERLRLILDVEISKWAFLHSGLTEAIINVGHHAYPSTKLTKEEKVWFMGGAFNRSTKELKVTFYDQGIGIPRSLPASELWERVLGFLDKLPIFERKRDEIMLKAAMEIDRSRTGEADRGKGLQDLLEFVKQRSNGYLSILSAKGLYKFTMKDGAPNIKTVNFSEPILGTLIIWRVILEN